MGLFDNLMSKIFSRSSGTAGATATQQVDVTAILALPTLR
jgi:hypothetical protein